MSPAPMPPITKISPYPTRSVGLIAVGEASADQSGLLDIEPLPGAWCALQPGIESRTRDTKDFAHPG